MQTFHNDPQVKAKYVARLKAHQDADEIIQGTGWENGKGCAVGCTLENYQHSQYPIELGIPEWLAHLEDNIFEGLPNAEAKLFPLQFLEAVPVGISEDELYKLRCDLDYARLSRLLKEQTKLFPEDEWGVQAAIEECMRLNSEYVDPYDKQWSAAESAAWSAAGSAARSAAGSAARSAESAARSAWSAARSAAESAESAESARSAWSAAWSAARSAWSAAWSARSAAWITERDTLLEKLNALK